MQVVSLPFSEGRCLGADQYVTSTRSPSIRQWMGKGRLEKRGRFPGKRVSAKILAEFDRQSNICFGGP